MKLENSMCGLSRVFYTVYVFFTAERTMNKTETTSNLLLRGQESQCDISLSHSG